ncbi:MAG: DUF4412 domain-containing protein [Verrucomicrobia bacterium]|nr:DUF4412 domain-containing protein [Verrucomicrobiota bacterium]
MKLTAKTAAAFALLLTATIAAFAQPAPGGAGAGMSASFTKLFGANNAFTADVQMDVTTADGRAMSMPASFAALDTKMRSEIDMTKAKVPGMPPGAMGNMKQLGMDRIINITRGDQKTIYIIYPGIKSYVRMALPKEDAATLEKEVKITTAALGKETVAGHPCVKNKVTMTAGDQQTQEFTVWNATDLKDFPVQIQTAAKEGSLLMRYSNIKFGKPDAAQFEPPTGYTAYTDIQQMMVAAMQKMMSQMGTPQ